MVSLRNILMASLLTFWGVVVSASICEPNFESERERASALNEDLRELSKRIADWHDEIASAVESGDEVKWRLVMGRISDYAYQLILNHKNVAFYRLVNSIEFPINRNSYESADEPFFYFGSSLLEAAIKGRNHQVFKALMDGQIFSNGINRQHPALHNWSQELTRIVAEDPVFSNYKESIITTLGRPFEPHVALYGRLSASTRKAFQELAKTPSTMELWRILSGFFPSGWIGVAVKDPDGSLHGATLLYEHTNKPVGGGMPWLQIAVEDSRYLKRGILVSRYSRRTQFNVINSAFEDGIFRNASHGQISWIREIEIKSNEYRILLERDRDGREYDHGTKYQELTIYFSDKGKLASLTLKNGNFLWSKPLWTTQTVMIPERARSFSGVYFDGEKDRSVTEIGDDEGED